MDSLIDSWSERGTWLSVLLGLTQAFRWFRRRRSPSSRSLIDRIAEIRLSYPLLKASQWDNAVLRAENRRLRALLLSYRPTSDLPDLTASPADLEEATRVNLNRRFRRKRSPSTKRLGAGPRRASGSRTT